MSIADPPQAPLVPTGRASPALTVIIPANNEADYIGNCLRALFRQDAAPGEVEIIVAANACTDATERIVASFKPEAARRRWTLICESHAEGGKIGALNRADALATGTLRVYLDADVTCDPGLLQQLRAALDCPEACYATGTIAVTPARSRVTRSYARLWTRLPFVQGGAVGAGLFAVNGAGRARWRAFPDVISDDTFVRLHFAPHERIEVPARYHWPMVEGFANLVRVRRRQDAGVAELYRRFPEVRINDVKTGPGVKGLIRLALSVPFAFVVYGAVHLAVRLRRPNVAWVRGR